MNEEDALTDWLVSYLEADTTLMGMLNGTSDAAVFPEGAPKTAASPFVRIDRLDGEDLMVVGLHRVWVDTTYHIRGLEKWESAGRPDRTEINAIGARLDALLHDHEASTATLHIASFREEPTPAPSLQEPEGYWLQSGGVYRFLAHAV